MTATTTTREPTYTKELLTECVHDLVDGIPGHPAISNEFYDHWIGGAVSYPQLRVFAEQYLARTVKTSVMVALSVLHTQDLQARTACVKNLYSEYGNGDASKAHLVLLENFFSDLLTRAAGKTVTAAEIHAADHLPTTSAFSAGQQRLFSSEDQRTVQGALLAQEHLAYSMLTRLYEGVRNYKYLYEDDDSFHEACEYFYVHIGEAEKEHKAEAIISASAVCETETDFEVVAAGFKRFMELTAQYWSGVNAAMLAVS